MATTILFGQMFRLDKIRIFFAPSPLNRPGYSRGWRRVSRVDAIMNAVFREGEPEEERHRHFVDGRMFEPDFVGHQVTSSWRRLVFASGRDFRCQKGSLVLVNDELLVSEGNLYLVMIFFCVYSQEDFRQLGMTRFGRELSWHPVKTLAGRERFCTFDDQ